MTFYGANNTISNTTTKYCKFDGIFITNSDNNTISDCTITSNDRYGITNQKSLIGRLIDRPNYDIRHIDNLISTEKFLKVNIEIDTIFFDRDNLGDGESLDVIRTIRKNN